jgi:hypothetical protein
MREQEERAGVHREPDRLHTRPPTRRLPLPFEGSGNRSRLNAPAGLITSQTIASDSAAFFIHRLSTLPSCHLRILTGIAPAPRQRSHSVVVPATHPLRPSRGHGHCERASLEAERYHRLVAKGKPKGVAIVALARHLLVVAYRLLVDGAPYRQMDTKKYEDKLQALAAYRPVAGGMELTQTAWAAERLDELTGRPSPYLEAHPRSRPLRRRKEKPRRDAVQEVTAMIARALAPV